MLDKLRATSLGKLGMDVMHDDEERQRFITEFCAHMGIDVCFFIIVLNEI